VVGDLLGQRQVGAAGEQLEPFLGNDLHGHDSTPGTAE
jgi:hypothetical protein